MSFFTADRDLNNLSAAMRPRVVKFLDFCEQKKLKVKVSEGFRTKARQLYLWSLGRYIDKALELRYLGIDHPDIYSRPKALKLTWTLESKHLDGMAIDIFFDKKGDIYNGPWNEVYDIAESCGLLSLYRTKGIDKPHLEFDPNFKIKREKPNKRLLLEARRLRLRNK